MSIRGFSEWQWLQHYSQNHHGVFPERQAYVMGLDRCTWALWDYLDQSKDSFIWCSCQLGYWQSCWTCLKLPTHEYSMSMQVTLILRPNHNRPACWFGWSGSVAFTQRCCYEVIECRTYQKWTLCNQCITTTTYATKIQKGSCFFDSTPFTTCNYPLCCWKSGRGAYCENTEGFLPW